MSPVDTRRDHRASTSSMTHGCRLFPRAAYLVPAPNVDHFRPENRRRMRPADTEEEQARFQGAALVFADGLRASHRTVLEQAARTGATGVRASPTKFWRRQHPPQT